MKRKLLVLIFGFLLFVSCKQTSTNYVAEISASQEKTEEISLTDEQKRDVYLRSLMDVETTLVEDEKIENDLLNILQGLKEKDELQKIVPTLQKVNNRFNDHYKYNIKIFPNLIPKSKLGRYSKYPWHYNWEALW